MKEYIEREAALNHMCDRCAEVLADCDQDCGEECREECVNRKALFEVPSADAGKSSGLISIEDAARAVQEICNNNGCPPDTDCYDGQNCGLCYQRYIKLRYKSVNQ